MSALFYYYFSPGFRFLFTLSWGFYPACSDENPIRDKAKLSTWDWTIDLKLSAIFIPQVGPKKKENLEGKSKSLLRGALGRVW
jgi:hypothetical protein